VVPQLGGGAVDEPDGQHLGDREQAFGDVPRDDERSSQEQGRKPPPRVHPLDLDATAQDGEHRHEGPHGGDGREADASNERQPPVHQRLRLRGHLWEAYRYQAGVPRLRGPFPRAFLASRLPSRGAFRPRQAGASARPSRRVIVAGPMLGHQATLRPEREVAVAAVYLVVGLALTLFPWVAFGVLLLLAPWRSLRGMPLITLAAAAGLVVVSSSTGELDRVFAPILALSAVAVGAGRVATTTATTPRLSWLMTGALAGLALMA